MEARNKQIKFTVTEKEYERIKAIAAFGGMSVAGYLRTVSLNGCILNDRFEEITEHTNELTSLRNIIMKMVYTMIKQGNHYPSDVEYIMNTMNEIMKSENKFIDIMRKATKQRNRETQKNIENIILNIKKD